MRIVVTGGSGKGGRVGRARPARRTATTSSTSTCAMTAAPFGLCMVADLTDLGQAQDALAGADAVVHFAAIPAPRLRPEGETFRINTLSTYNVFAAAVAHRMRRVVWASSETVLGLPFDRPPDFAPIDETHRAAPGERPTRCRSSSARRWRRSSRGAAGSGSSGCGSRTSWNPADYAAFPSYWDDARLRKWNLWGYVDARDVAAAARLALDAEVDGADVAIVAAADTVMTRPSADLMAEVFPTRAAATGGRRTRHPARRSTTPDRSSATSRRTAGPTTSQA